MAAQCRANNSVDADVGIVGAGPAGAAMACHFSRAGFRVVMIDQRRFPRDKVCGDFVGPAALEELDQLGVLSQQRFANATKIRNGALYINGEKLVDRPFPRVGNLRDYGLCIPRVLLDEAVVNTAVAAGAHLIEESRALGYETDTTGVTVFYTNTVSRKRIRIRLLIGADGSSSLVARTLRAAKPARRDLIIAVRTYFEGVEGPPDQADIYLNSSCFPGYYWLFPTGSDTANVGIGMPLEVCAGIEHRQLSRLLAHLIESDPAIGGRLANARVSAKIVGWPLAIFNPRLPIVDNRVALIGDAAGFINPLSGEGIQYALRSARWCSEALREGLYSDNLSASGLRPYASRAQTELRCDMAFSRLVVDLTKHRALHTFWLSALGALAKKLASDSRCYDVAAGVFAGIVSAKELLALPLVRRTAKPTAVTLSTAASEALADSRHLQKNSVALMSTAASILKGLVRHPVATMKWSVDCIKSAFELATQMAIAARRWVLLSPRATLLKR